MGIEVGLFGLIILILDIWAIIKTFNSSASAGTKAVWIAVILVLPVLGFLLWLIFGPKA